MVVASDNENQTVSVDTNPAQRMLAALASSIWRAREQISVSAHAEKYRVLPSKTSADAGPWRTDKVPYLVEPMDMFGDDRVTTITLMFAAQMGKSEAMLNMMLYATLVLGVSQIVMYPTEADIKEFRHKRLEPGIKETKAWAAAMIGKKPITDLGVTFRGLYLDFAWSQSDRTQKGKARGIVFCDEIDEYPDQSSLDRLRNRSKTFPHPKFVSTSTPSDEDFGVDREFKQGDKRKLHCPCPNCGEFQTLVFKQLRWEGGANAKPDDVKANTWYECPTCLYRIEERLKPWMVTRGVWVPAGCTPPQPCQDVPNPRPLRGDGSPVAPYPVPSHVSYQLSELYSLFGVGRGGSWGSIAAEFCKHKGNPPQTFFTERLGEAYSSKGRTIDVHLLQKLCVLSKDGGYKKREIPLGVRVLLAGIDVQHNRYYYLCRGFGPNAAQTWMIDEREIFFQTGPQMPQIVEFIRTVKYEQERTSPDGVTKVKQKWRPLAWAVDTGDQTRTIYEGVIGKFAPARADVPTVPNVYAIKGRGGGQGGQGDSLQPYTTTTIGEVGKEKAKLAAAVKLIGVNTAHYKNAIDREWRGDPRLGLLTDQKGEVIGSVCSYLPGDTSRDYLDHITSEWYKKISEKTKGGWGTSAWVKRPGVERNDFLDLEVYVRCLADKLGAAQNSKILTGFVFVGKREGIDASAGGATGSARPPTAPRREIKVSVPGLRPENRG